MRRPKNILIMAATGDYNLGDELIVESEIRYFQERYPDAQITVCVYDPASQIARPQEVRVIHYFPYQIRRQPLHNLWYLIQNIIALACADMVVIGGGGIFFDNESGTSFRKTIWQWWMRITFARIFGARIVFFGISLEIKKEKNLKYLTKLFHSGDTVLPRDTRSTVLLKNIQVPATTISDIVFLSQSVFSPKQEPLIKKVGLSLRSGFRDDDTWISVLLEFLHAHGYEVVFLSHSLHPHPSHNDLAILQEFTRGLNVSSTHSLEETLAIYSELDAVIGMRFHAIVLAALHATPVIPISYGPKTDALASELAIDDLKIDVEDFDIKKFAKCWHHLERDYMTISQDIHDRATQIQKKLLQQLRSPDILGKD